ncbi:hypothetical protein GUJ93_ZPchr0012g21288 [Zizania palustris]|uniref:Uncharacterized protein n=1 Tax=Zizania palustris TaxID=103762 RepID=A0A8J5WQJ6_ZIZPA|nr:hypothetical protein GUJ93_ZPchr0012g21288 [Zizania palustris]
MACSVALVPTPSHEIPGLPLPSSLHLLPPLILSYPVFTSNSGRRAPAWADLTSGAPARRSAERIGFRFEGFAAHAMTAQLWPAQLR